MSDNAEEWMAKQDELARRNRRNPYREPWPVNDWAKENEIEPLQHMPIIQAAMSPEGLFKDPKTDWCSYITNLLNDPEARAVITQLIMQVLDGDNEELRARLSKCDPTVAAALLGFMSEVHGRLRVTEQIMRMAAAHISFVLDELVANGEIKLDDGLASEFYRHHREVLEERDKRRISGEAVFP